MLSALHLYPKTPNDLTVKTRVGGGISIVAVAVMSLLFLTELQAYMSTRFETTLSLDDNIDQKLLIDFSLSLPHLPCQVAVVEVSDVFGAKKVTDSASSIYKHRLDEHGNRGELVGGSVSSSDAGRMMTQAQTGITTQIPPEDADFEKQPLAPAEFDAAVGSFDLVMVNFFAPWCPHCIRFAPIWAEAGRFLDETEYADDVVLAKVRSHLSHTATIIYCPALRLTSLATACLQVDCNEHHIYCTERHAIDRFPTVRTYANSGADMVPYEGAMGNAAAIVGYIKSVMSTRRSAAAEVASDGTAALQYDVGEGVQI